MDAMTDPREQLIADVCQLCQERLPAGAEDALSEFAALTLHDLPPDDAGARSADQTYGALLSLWKLAGRRKPGGHAVRVYNPRLDEHGWTCPHTVIETVAPNMPFIVDSVVSALQGFNGQIYQLIHPVAPLKRDANGALTGCGEGGEPESLIQIEFSTHTDPADLAAMEKAIGEAIRDVTLAVQGWRPMLDTAEKLVVELETSPPALPEDEITEGIALLRWINQLTKLGRVRDTVDRIEEATDTSMRGRVDLPYLGGGPLGDETRGAPVPSDTVGYVQFIDTDKLSAICEDLGAEIDVQVLPGVFVYQGSVLARVAGQDEVGEEAAERIRDTFTIGLVRTIDQDPRFGLVVLCEVAQRALSPGVNDPGTAIDVIGRQTRLLSYWGDAWEGADRVEPKYPRLRVPALDYHDMFEDAFNLIARDGAAQVEVVLRLTKALKALTTIGPEPSRAAARRQLEVALTRARAQLPIDDDHRRLDEALEMPRPG